MLKFFSSQKNIGSRESAQAMVEFAIALPILMVMLVGILEVGRMIFVYASVISASREAARYASAVGLADGGAYYKYQYCAGIREVARRSALLVPLPDAKIKIFFDSGPSSIPVEKCAPGMTADTSITVKSGDRVTVEVTVDVEPLVKLIPINPPEYKSISRRTILGILQLSYP